MDPYLSVAFLTYAMLIRPPRPPWGPLGKGLMQDPETFLLFLKGHKKDGRKGV